MTLLALAACGASPEREKQAQELAAAEKKLAEAKTFNEDMARERQLVATKLAEAQARLDKVRAEYQGTLAGAAYLTEEGNGLSRTWEMNASREGFLLKEAVRQKDKEAIEGVAARVLADERPCSSYDDDEGALRGHYIGCVEEPVADACINVEKNNASSPDWVCATLAGKIQDLPQAAFCTWTLEHPAPGEGVDSPYAEQSLPTALQAVRVAFAHEGRLYVSDYPEPAPALYNPPNVGPLVECKSTNARNECLHNCEVRFDRYHPCDEYDDELGDESGEENGPEDDVSDEPIEVRQARQAAAEAEAEAEEARKRAEEAQEEVSYQECLSSCEPGSRKKPGEPENSVEPVSTTVTSSLEASPAPGVFLVSRVVRTLGPKDAVMHETKSLLLLKHPGLVALWQNKALPPSETLGALEPIAELDEVVDSGGKPSVAPLPGLEGPVLVGMRAGAVKAYAMKTQAGQEPVVELGTAAVCAALRAEPKRFPEAYLKACSELPAPATGQQEAAPAGALKTPADAGSAADAGEVAP